jgi:hypothetical protein
MRKSNYIGMTSGDWTCTFYGVDYLQPAYKKKRDAAGRRVRNKSAGHCQYYYVFERRTSDGLADKSVRLTAGQALRVKRGQRTVESIAEKRRSIVSPKYVDKVSYCYD